MELIKAKEPFRFYTRLHLSELTGLKADSLFQLLEIIKTVSGSCIYHHTHRFLQQHLYLSPEPPNDFAYWVSQSLGEVELGEMLASIDTVEYSTIRLIRDKISATIEDYLKNNSQATLRVVHKGEEFHFIKSVSFILPTVYLVHDLKEFVLALEKVTIDSIYFHIFEAKLRISLDNNDFSNWIEHSLGNRELAEKFNRIDPYTQTLEGLRKNLIQIVESGLES